VINDRKSSILSESDDYGSIKSEETKEDLKVKIATLERSNRLHQTNFDEIKEHAKELEEQLAKMKSDKEQLEGQMKEQSQKIHLSL